ncbi:hypothetical protein [Listeria rocourtiae]|uniref:hypothetical protein n=1 Tax=Listeria rocourtiae TaxID=647910 RepID=UPI0003E8B1AA|nr:hypothetical protein [Listeria rocourtiae]EUJ44406.1 hypothetical protein PROCOU_13923 [Listeria rocourtiae FSL F6-920]
MRINMHATMGSSLSKKLDIALYEKAVGVTTERQVLASSSKTARYAPRKTSALANSFPASVHKVDATTWAYGSDREYAEIQEHTNRNKKRLCTKDNSRGHACFQSEPQERSQKGG